jgi:hypothetical protein
MGILKKKNPPIERLKQAYKQAPWRVQLQSIGLYLLPIVVIALITIIYLNISAQAATAGLQILDLRVKEEDIQRSIANERTHLALLTTYNTMQHRSEALGYFLIGSDNSIYMTIPGYKGRDVVLLAPLPEHNLVGQTLSDPRFQQSIWDWFYNMFVTNEISGKGEPH